MPFHSLLTVVFIDELIDCLHLIVVYQHNIVLRYHLQAVNEFFLSLSQGRGSSDNYRWAEAAAFFLQ